MVKEGHYIRKQLETEVGLVTVHGPITQNLIRTLEIDYTLKSFRPPLKQKIAISNIASEEHGKIFIAQNENTIIGYVTFHRPDSFERWIAGPKETIELGAIEVAKEYRDCSVAKNLLEVAFAHPMMEDYIVIVTEYYWHWDLEGTGLSIWEYRDLMRHLMSYVGMVVKDSNDEEIRSHPANLLMVRYGKRVPHNVILNFESILFI